MIDKIMDELSRVGLEVHTKPEVPADTAVLLCRLKPYSAQDKELKFATVILNRFVRNLLLDSRGKEESFQVRVSRPWLLKGDDLVYTYDFTFKGDLEAASQVLTKAVDATMDPNMGTRLPTRPRKRRHINVSFAGG